jgi:hypothetical protein
VQLIRGDFIHYIPSIQKEFEGGFLVCVMVLACSFPVKKNKIKSPQCWDRQLFAQSVEDLEIFGDEVHAQKVGRRQSQWQRVPKSYSTFCRT